MAGNRGPGRPANDRYKNLKAEVIRDRIKATTLINRLVAHATGQIEMTATQVQAAQILLRKVLPDLAAVDNHHTGPIMSYVIAPKKASHDEWAKFLEAKQAALPAENAAAKARAAAMLKPTSKPKALPN